MTNPPIERRGTVMADNVTLMLLKSIEELERKSNTDDLTGLYNRSFWTQEIPILEKSSRLGFAIVSIDVDGLKEINDTYGHAVGDRHIQSAANVVRHAFRSEDHVIRFGGDEICVVAPFDLVQLTASYDQYITSLPPNSPIPTLTGYLETVLGDRLQTCVLESNQKLAPQQHTLQLSFGIEVSIPTSSQPHHNLAKTYNQADAKMYQMKKRHHQTENQL
jgi:GGDEF domain-containing protein